MVSGGGQYPRHGLSSRPLDLGKMAGPGGVLTAAVLWGTVGPAQVLSGSEANPGALGVARLAIGGLVLGLATWRRVPWPRLLGRDVLGWIVLAAAATGLYQVTFMHAVDQVGAGLGTAIALGVAPIATGICSRLWTGERLTGVWLAGTVASIAGCVILLTPSSDRQASTSGVVLALVSGSCYGIYTVAAKKFLKPGIPAAATTALTLIVAALVLSPIIWLTPAHLLDAETAGLVAWTGIAGTALAYAAFVTGLRRTTAATAGTLSLAEPLIAALLAVLVLHEPLSPAAATGGLMLLAGLMIITIAAAAPTTSRRVRTPVIPDPTTPRVPYSDTTNPPQARDTAISNQDTLTGKSGSV